MKDPEFIELKNRFFLGSLICIVFFGLVFFILWTRLTNRDPEIIRKVKQKEDIIIFVTEENCETCNIAENALIQEELIYETISKEEKNYKKIVRRQNCVSNGNLCEKRSNKSSNYKCSKRRRNNRFCRKI